MFCCVLTNMESVCNVVRRSLLIFNFLLFTSQGCRRSFWGWAWKHGNYQILLCQYICNIKLPISCKALFDRTWPAFAFRICSGHRFERKWGGQDLDELRLMISWLSTWSHIEPSIFHTPSSEILAFLIGMYFFHWINGLKVRSSESGQAITANLFR